MSPEGETAESGTAAGFFRRVIDGGEEACPAVKAEVVEMMKRFPLYESYPND